MLSALKNFAVTFLIAAVLFGVAAYFVTGFLTNTVTDILENEHNELDNIMNEPDKTQPGEETTDTETPAQPTDEPKGESFNFLIVTTDYRPDLYNDYEPDLTVMNGINWVQMEPEETIGCLSQEYRERGASSLVLVRIDKEQKKFVYTYITPLIRVYTETGFHTLSDTYMIYGREKLAQYIHAMTGLTVDYTFVLDGYDMDEFINYLGGVTAQLSKNVYSDGVYATTNFETEREQVGEDGAKWTERIPNTLLWNAGSVYTSADALNLILSCREESQSDISNKQIFAVGVLQSFLGKIAGMEDGLRRNTLARLITPSAWWGNLDEMGLPIQPVQTTDQTPVPFDTTPTGEEGTVIWSSRVWEPEDAILDTDFAMRDYDSVIELLEMVDTAESVILTYPCSYLPATKETDACFTADLNRGVDQYLIYRHVTEPSDTN